METRLAVGSDFTVMNLSQAPRSFKSAFKGARTGFVLVGVFSCFLNLLHLVVPIYMMQIYDRVLSSGRFETLAYLTALAVIALIVLGILDGARTAVLARIAGWIATRTGDEVLEASVRRSLTDGPALNAGLRDLSRVESFIGSPSVNPVFDAPWAPIFLVLIGLLHPVLGAIALFAAVLLFLIALANEYFTRGQHVASTQAREEANRFAEYGVSNAEPVIAMGMLDRLTSLWRERDEAARKDTIAAISVSAWWAGTGRAVRLIVQIAMLGVGAYLVLINQLSPGAMIAASLLLARALAPVEQSISAWRSFVGARDAFNRLDSTLAESTVSDDRLQLPPPKPELAVHDVAITLPGQELPLLRGVNFDLGPGDSLALIGPSGAGKSVLCRSLVGLVKPARGTVRLGGADLHAQHSDDIGAHIGYLPQSVDLFAGTIGQNIARLDMIDPEKVIEATTLLELHEYFLALPNGYETEIGPNGSFLSGGQRQLVGLARAVYGVPQLIVLDEPNAHLDQDSEQRLLRALDRLSKLGSVVVITAQRVSLLKAVKKVGVINKGQLLHYGTRDAVLRDINLPPKAQAAGKNT